MKIKISVVFLLLAVAFGYMVLKQGYISSSKSSSRGPAISSSALIEQIVAWKAVDYHAKPVVLNGDDLKAHDVIVHLWASWCSPCVNEVPELIEYAKRNAGTQFVIVSSDESEEDIQKFLKSFPEFDSDRFIKIWDKDGGFAKIVDADRLPMSIIIKRGDNAPRIVKSVVDWKNL